MACQIAPCKKKKKKSHLLDISRVGKHIYKRAFHLHHHHHHLHAKNSIRGLYRNLYAPQTN